LIQEYNGSGSLLKNYLQGAGMDEMVARFGPSNANRIWYYQDGRGNTSHVADDTGALIETYTYDLGGKPFITTATGKTSPHNRFLYNGRDYSSFTELYDFRNRFYQPSNSRFIQSDPIGLAGGNHLYRFCGNSGVNTGDPLGLLPIYQNNPPTQADQPPSYEDIASLPDGSQNAPADQNTVFDARGRDFVDVNGPAPANESMPDPVFTLDRTIGSSSDAGGSNASPSSGGVSGSGLGTGGGIGSGGGGPGGVSMDLRSITEGSVGPVGIGNGENGASARGSSWTPHSGGIIANVDVNAGISRNGGAASGSIASGNFASGTSPAAFMSYGAWGGTVNGYYLSKVYIPGQSPTVYGASGGLTVGFWASNATTRSALYGPFMTYNVSLWYATVTYSVSSNGTKFGSVTASPWTSGGLSYSAYPTFTVLVGH
jgi:RHS repeat-associated protein